MNPLTRDHTHTRIKDHEHPSHLDSVLDFTGVVSYDEGRLHDSGELDVGVSLMLTLELVQQGLIGSLRETGRRMILSDCVDVKNGNVLKRKINKADL